MRFYQSFQTNLLLCKTRKKDTLLNRLHTGRSYLTLFFHSEKEKKKKEEPSVCIAFYTMITIKHILIECAVVVELRNKYFEEKSLYLLFRNVKP